MIRLEPLTATPRLQRFRLYFLPAAVAVGSATEATWPCSDGRHWTRAVYERERGHPPAQDLRHRRESEATRPSAQSPLKKANRDIPKVRPGTVDHENTGVRGSEGEANGGMRKKQFGRRARVC